MEPFKHFLGTHWLDLLLLGIGLALGVCLLFTWQRRKAWSRPLLLSAAAFALLGLGGLALPLGWAFWVTAASLATLFGMLFVLIVTGSWSAPLGFGVGAFALLGLGGIGTQPLAEALTEGAKAFASLEPTQPWWLLLLGFMPVIIALSFRSLAGLGPVRRWLAIGLRCALILFLTLALAEVRLRHENEHLTVLFLVDRSLSIPEDFGPDASTETTRVDRRLERIEQFINQAVYSRGAEHERDRAGLILFGRRPRLELPPSDAPRFNFRFKEAASTIDGSYTDIAAAIKLALASFPEGTGKRVILFSDGNENLGNAEEQARAAERNGVQIDVVPLATGQRNENEVLVQGVEAPAFTEQGSRVPIKVFVRSYNPRTVRGTLTLKQVSEGETAPVAPSPLRVQVRPGLNRFDFQQPLAAQKQSFTYEAIFQPEISENDRGEFFQGLPGDRVQNNRATTHVVALGQRKLLLIEPKDGEHQLLVDHLRGIGDSKYKMHTLTVDALPQNKDDLAVFLSGYDCVLLANVAASDIEAGNVPADRMGAVITEQQQEVLRSNTHDQGCGLIMIGGPNSFGAGGWQGTPVEKALPVDCDIKALKIQGKGGLALMMHASEMADGNRWQKEIAKLAIRKLSPNDEVGILHFDWGVTKWHIPMQVIGQKRGALLGLVDRMMPGDMPEMDTALKMAYDALTDPARGLATKHVIIISDGDPVQSNKNILRQMKEKKVTVTTVGVATHGAPMDQALKAISDATGGRFYKVNHPKALPAIYIKETRLVSQSFIDERRFVPQLVYKAGPTDKLPDNLNPLYGYVRTTPKESPLVEMPILAPQVGEQQFPILAYWHYGLGKSVAFTSDARSLPTRPAWDRDWAGSEMYKKFWEQVVDWALRPVETGRLTMTSEYRDGRVKVTVEARDDNNRPLVNLNLRGGVSPPGGAVDDARKLELRFEQKNSGTYEAEFKAEEAGSYFINAQATRLAKVIKDGKEVEVQEGADSIRGGVTIPYSPEFSDLESNTALLERVRGLTGGKTFADDDQALAEAARAGEAFRPGLPHFKNLQPIWYWLVFLTAVGLFFDVAVRRIAVDPLAVAAATERVWERLRGREVRTDATPQFFDRLQSRKAQVSETLDRARTTRRFEGGENVAAAPAGAEAAAVDPPRRPSARTASPSAIGPEKQEEAADYASRLLRAKKRVWQDRDQDKEP
jgi:uncharacterized membrane protein